MPNPPNPEIDPVTAFAKLDDDQFTAQRAVTTNYTDFSAEVLRLSLLGIGVIGFVYDKLLTTLPPQSRREAAASLILFGFAAGSALVHRYFNSETLRLYVWGLRFHSVGQPVAATKCLRSREWRVRVCMGSKIVAAVCLGAGAFVLALAFTRGLL